MMHLYPQTVLLVYQREAEHLLNYGMSHTCYFYYYESLSCIYSSYITKLTGM